MTTRVIPTQAHAVIDYLTGAPSSRPRAFWA
jgi:hypothetical protein